MYGWDDGFAESFAPYAGRGFVPGRIIRVDRGRVDAVVPDGAGVRTVLADTAPVATGDPLRVPCTGDWAVIDLENGRVGPQLDGLVRALLPRRTAFVRSASSKRSDGQILAANADHAVIAVSLAEALDLDRVERFVSLAWESGAQPVLALTKADLVADGACPAQLVADVEDVAPGVRVRAVSAETGEGVQALAAALATGTAVLLGRSGAGKSTLANALAGRPAQRVQAIRDRDGKGRHTTTTRDLLPLPGGGVLIDTPGLRGVGMWDAGDGLSRTFADVEEWAARCRFHDCAHGTEPDCAVRDAVDGGLLSARRLDSYRKLQRENRRIVAKTDVRLRAEMRREWRLKQAEGRERSARKRGPLAGG
ncbi:ribosome small subunit-dependent GTPase A [Streptomyces benahoarensis]|uniref:Small ribosomal subunit biogenesis GTPase RsgA n=1 Tax=Streptomyces benahoarensis TaxID=2595054 RepID=A0A553YTJ6_9ACTN|nr:ribosome small subunit-dependent GTPase A [Streptomyces benahoarensis]TSB08903.1 ribosome small subunit-dependent GTPase A [Streptomyces benahoarensis]TSB32519.1 ribosome small subunit-dependent GTPase A [Streptomyces benahoarensis]